MKLGEINICPPRYGKKYIVRFSDEREKEKCAHKQTQTSWEGLYNIFSFLVNTLNLEYKMGKFFRPIVLPKQLIFMRVSLYLNFTNYNELTFMFDVDSHTELMINDRVTKFGGIAQT